MAATSVLQNKETQGRAHTNWEVFEMENRGVARVTVAPIAFALMLGACSGETSDAEAPGDSAMAEGPTPLTARDDGPDICFQKAREKIGEDAKVASVSSWFSTGREIDGSASSPRGHMITCIVEYQDPDNPNAMLEMTWDGRTGAFRSPQRMEIMPIGGDPEDFRLDEFVVPLKNVNTSGLMPFLMDQKDDLASAYSDFELAQVRLEPPDFDQESHTLSVTVAGRLATNDIKDSGMARLALDGQTVLSNDLIP